MRSLTALDWIALILVIIGGLNWGLVGLFNVDIVATIFGATIIADIVYVLIGLAALYLLVISGSLHRREMARA